MKKRIVTLLLFLSLSGSSLWSQSNEIIDHFLSRESADTETTLLFIGQAAGLLALDSKTEEAYNWGTEKYSPLKKLAPGDSIPLGTFFLVLLKSFDREGGFFFRRFPTPRYAALEARYRGYTIGPVYTNRTLPPEEVFYALSRVLEERNE